MIQSQTKEIGGFAFTFTPMNPFKALVLDKKVLSLLTPIIAGIKNIEKAGETEDITEILDFKLVSEGLGEALGKMSGAEFETFARDLLRNVVVEVPGQGAFACGDDKGAMHVFTANISLMYEVMIEVMRYNKFSPFALMERGVGIDEIVTSLAPKSTPKRRGPALGRSGR